MMDHVCGRSHHRHVVVFRDWGLGRTGWDWILWFVRNGEEMVDL